MDGSARVLERHSLEGRRLDRRALLALPAAAWLLVFAVAPLLMLPIGLALRKAA